MQKISIFAAIFIVAAFISVPAIAADSSDQAAIGALEQRIAKGVEAKDANAVMANYVPGDSLMVFDLIPPREYDGADAY